MIEPCRLWCILHWYHAIVGEGGGSSPVDILSRYHYEVAYIVSQLEIPFLDMDIAT